MLIYICILVLVPSVLSYSSGPSANACENMTPGHGGQPQSSSPQYQITFPQGQTTYSEGETISVTLEATGSDKIRGFMIQARPSKDNYTTYGSFPSFPSGTRNPCVNKGSGKNVVITHSEASDKDRVTFNWKAPAANVGDIVFVFSVVKTKSLYWVKGVTAQVLKYKAKPTNTPTNTQTVTPTVTTTNAPTETTSKSTTTKQSQTSGQTDRDPECDMSIGCFPSSAMCSTNCDYLVTWKTSGMNDVEFTLKRKTSSNNYWIAIGLSDNGKMFNSSVTECVSNNGVVDVKNSFNNDSQYMNTRSNGNQQYGLMLVSGSYSDGILSCTFKRKKTATLAGVATANEDDTFFSLTEKWYLLVAHGSAAGGNKMKHTEYPKFSTSRIDFLQVSTDTGTTPAMGETGMIKKDRRCGESIGCYHDCKSGNCGFLLTWKENGDDIDFTLTCKRPGNNVFCAIGASKDKKMGDDSVFECVSSDSTVIAYVSYNDGRNNYRLKTPEFGLSKIVASHEDGILKCQFSRKKTFSQVSNMNGRKKRAVDPAASTYFDFNNDYNLLYAFGTAIGGNLNKHQTHPVISSRRADFQRFTDIGAAATSKDRIIIHGIFMIFAWVFFANFGIFMARFYKTVWPEGMEWCGQKRWFVIHRLAMVTVFLLTAASVVIIFVHVGGYSEIVGTNFAKAHPILGIIVMCLATINPIMALFRPHPGTPKRPYFNFAHISVGVTAYVCGIVNIFAGFEQEAIEVPYSARIVIWVALGWIGLIEITSFIYDCQHKKGNDEGTSPILGYNSSKGEAYELKDVAAADGQGTQRVSTLKIVILCVHVLGLLAFAIAASAIVAMGEHDDMHDEM